MPALSLFNVKIPADGSDHALGDQLGAGRAALAPDGQTVQLRFSGALPRGRARFEVTLRCAVRDDTITLLGIVSGTVSEFSIGQPLADANWDLQGAELPAIQLMPGAAEALSFKLPLRLIQEIFNKVVGPNGTIETIQWGDLGFEGWPMLSATFRVEPGTPRALFVRDPTFAADPAKYQVTVEDLIVGGPEHSQKLLIDRLGATSDTVWLALSPANGALLIHPDPLDLHNAGADDNDLLYQHALVNGHLEWKIVNGGSAHDYNWRAHPIAKQPAGLVAFRLHDEHGHPLFIEGDSFPLGYRNGLFGPSDPDDGRTYEQTLRAAVVRDPAGLQIGGLKLRSIDPLSVDLEGKGRDDLFFIDPKTKLVAPKGSPREIHGLAQGSYLQRAAAGDIDCELHALELVAADNDPNKDYYGSLFTHTHLRIPSATDWQLITQHEEREVFPDLTLAGGGAIGVRTAQAAAGRPLQLPLIDTHYACSNLVSEVQRRQKLPTYIATTSYQAVKQHDEVLKTAFPSTTSRLPQTHEAGHSIIDPNQASITFEFHEVLEPPPGIVEKIGDTARRGARLKPKVTHFLHGGDRTPDAVNKVADDFSQPWSPDLIKRRQEVKAFWNRAPAGQEPVRAALRDFLAPRVASSGLTDSTMRDLYRTALTAVLSDKEIEGLGKDLGQLAATVKAHAALDQWKLFWDAPPDALSVLLVEYAWQRATDDLFRSLRDALYDHQGTPIAAVAARLSGVRDALRLLVSGDVALPLPDAWKVLNAIPAGAVTSVIQGVDSLYKELEDFWQDRLPAELQWLRTRYGAGFTRDVYRTLSNPGSADGVALLNAFKAASAPALKAIGDIASEPPEYLFLTKQFQVARGAESQADEEALWRKLFRLCNIGKQDDAAADSFWNIFLTQDSSVIVKLGGKRSIKSILEEIDGTYKATDRARPLGVDLALLEGRLHPDLRDDASWRGLFLVNPTADISADTTLSDLAGLKYITALYVAIAGAKLAQDSGVDLDLYASIYQEAHEPPAVPEQDVSLSLVKFDVTIKHTQIEAGEIVFYLDLQNVWGRKEDESVNGTSKKLPKVHIRGTLPPRAPKTQGADAPRAFEFAAWFTPAVDVKIDLAFIDTVSFKAIRVGRNKGQAAIDIDCDLKLQNMSAIGIPIPIELYEQGDNAPTIGLQNFRILLPSVDDAGTRRLGTAKGLGFDFPSINFALPKPRVLHLGGLEIKPIQIGFIRKAAEALAALAQQYNWLGDQVTMPSTGDFELPYLRFEIDFGKLPSLGGTNLSGLKFDILFALQKIDAPPYIKTFIGIAGLSAKQIKIDLFRLLTLEIDDLLWGKYRTQHDPPGGARSLSALTAQNVKLKILDWSPFGDRSELQFLVAEKNDQGASQKRVAALGFADFHHRKIGILELQWLLLGHNIDLDPKILDYLVFSKPPAGDLVNLVKKIIEGDQINADVSADESWLFGAAFGIGSFIESCRLVLCDQHYYGISISSTLPWFKFIFGDDQVGMAYIMGARRDLDRFRTSFRLACLDLIGNLRSGEIALEWGVNWDFLIDFGFPWRGSDGYDWFRAFSVPAGIFEAKFGFYFEKRHQLGSGDSTSLQIGAGVGLYLGLFAGFTAGPAWARVGIGVFAILEGVVEFADSASPNNPLKGSLRRVQVTGVIGIFAYGEGGIDIWIISARFRVQLQASCTGILNYLPGGTSTLAYFAEMSASYSASVRIGHGWFSFEFSVSGSLSIHVSGQLLLT